MRYKEVVFITIAVRASNLFNNTQKQPMVSPSVSNPKIDCRSHDLSFYRADIRVSSVSVLQGIVCILIFVGVAMAMEHPRWAANIRYEKCAVATIYQADIAQLRPISHTLPLPFSPSYACVYVCACPEPVWVNVQALFSCFRLLVSVRSQCTAGRLAGAR